MVFCIQKREKKSGSKIDTYMTGLTCTFFQLVIVALGFLHNTYSSLVSMDNKIDYHRRNNNKK